MGRRSDGLRTMHLACAIMSVAMVAPARPLPDDDDQTCWNHSGGTGVVQS